MKFVVAILASSVVVLGGLGVVAETENPMVLESTRTEPKVHGVRNLRGKAADVGSEKSK